MEISELYIRVFSKPHFYPGSRILHRVCVFYPIDLFFFTLDSRILHGVRVFYSEFAYYTPSFRILYRVRGFLLRINVV